MKLIHTADLHLDADCGTSLTKEQAKERRGELLRTFLGIVRYAAENGVEAILISGDLFDKKRISRTVSNAVHQAILEHPGILFFYLRGNHDAAGFLEEFEILPDNLRLFSDTWTSYPVGREGSVVISGVEISEKNPGIYDSFSLSPEKINLVMMHGQESESNGKGGAEVIRLKSLRNRFIDYLALGHIHSYKKAELDARGVYVYPGCPEPHGFDECGEKGFVQIEIDEREKIVDSYFVPFAKRTFYEIQVDVSGTKSTAEIRSMIREALLQADISKESAVKVVLIGTFDAEDEKNIPFLEEAFLDEFYAVRVKDETKLRVDYSRYEGDLSLKGEFIRLVNASDLPKERKARIIRAGIAALRNEEVME